MAHLEIFDLIVKDLNNNDYLMIKGSNSTGLNKGVKNLIRVLDDIFTNFKFN